MKLTWDIDKLIHYMMFPN